MGSFWILSFSDKWSTKPVVKIRTWGSFLTKRDNPISIKDLKEYNLVLSPSPFSMLIYTQKIAHAQAKKRRVNIEKGAGVWYKEIVCNFGAKLWKFWQEFCRPVSELSSDWFFWFDHSNKLLLYIEIRYGQDKHCLKFLENKYQLTSFYDVINIFYQSTNFGQNWLFLVVKLGRIAKAWKKWCIN